ncbi:helix-turn-helix domain-containing protein [Cucumibacter marinus]|uniref:helix-turn-helix domain-containing protein n=1 Tax=Cucumibacter marinus TaxID=1121252 RepID=UPI000688BBCF|nr:helix-turn-helix domain-containing protein [Cucumibacter marinus]
MAADLAIVFSSSDLDKGSRDRTGVFPVLSVVSSARRVSVDQLLLPNRAPASVALARQIAMYLTHVALGRNFTQVARLFGRDRTTAAHACQIIEDLRDEPSFDLQMHCLEVALLAQAKVWGQVGGRAVQ